MPVITTRPPVTAKGVDLAEAQEIAAALADLADGDFVSTGAVFPIDVKKHKTKKGATVERDEGRAKANAAASGLIRTIESRYDVKLRSRTWEVEGGWTFGIRPKDSEAAPSPSPDAA